MLDAYENSAAGKKESRAVDIASGIRPPDLDDFEWGSIMVIEESQALPSSAEFHHCRSGLALWFVPADVEHRHLQIVEDERPSCEVHAVRLERDGDNAWGRLFVVRIEDLDDVTITASPQAVIRRCLATS